MLNFFLTPLITRVIKTKENMEGFRIGEKIKALRQKKGLTLQAVAKETGFSSGLISQIENNNVSPPIATLSRIARCLDVRMAYFFDDEGTTERYEVVRNNERRRVERVIGRKGTKHGYSYEALAFRLKTKKMEPFLLTVSAEKLDEESLYSHDGEEFWMVIEGETELVYDTRKIELKEGDCVYFDSSVKHRLLRKGNKEAKVLVVICR